MRVRENAAKISSEEAATEIRDEAEAKEWTDRGKNLRQGLVLRNSKNS